jgi:hypothetical protein
MAAFYRYVGRFSYRSVEEKRVIRVSVRPELFLALLSLLLTRATALSLSFLNTRTSSAYAHDALKCETGAQFDSVVSDAEPVAGEHLSFGHNGPVVLLSSDRPGSDNWTPADLTLFTDALQMPTGGSPSPFQLHPSHWFCPERISTRVPASNRPGVDLPPISLGVARVPWPASVRVGSLAEDALNDEVLTPTRAVFIAQGSVGTTSIPHKSSITTCISGPGISLWPNRGGRLSIYTIAPGRSESTTRQDGLLTTSAASSRFAPTRDCPRIFSDCHPMCNTSAAQARVTRAVRVYFIACCNESSHGDFCERLDPRISACLRRNEGLPGDQEPVGNDGAGWLLSSSSLLMQVWGCLATSSGFTGILCRPEAWSGRPPVPSGDLCDRSARVRDTDRRALRSSVSSAPMGLQVGARGLSVALPQYRWERSMHTCSPWLTPVWVGWLRINNF